MTGAEYRKLRNKLKLSQPALAEKLGIDKATIFRREKGDVPITRESEYALRWLAIARSAGSSPRLR